MLSKFPLTLSNAPLQQCKSNMISGTSFAFSSLGFSLVKNCRSQTCPEVQSCQTLEFVEWTEIRLTRICTRSWSKAGVSAHTKCMSAHGKVQVTETPSVVWLQQWRGSAVSSFHATLENLINWATILITNIQTFFSLTLANFKFDLWQNICARGRRRLKAT